MNKKIALLTAIASISTMGVLGAPAHKTNKVLLANHNSKSIISTNNQKNTNSNKKVKPLNLAYDFSSTNPTLWTGTIQNCSSVYINQSPEDGATHVASVTNGMSVNVLGENNGWYLVDSNGYIGYIASSYVNVNIQKPIFTGTIQNCSEVYINQSPADGGVHLATVTNGTSLNVLGEVNGWYIVQYNGNIGYIYNYYLSSPSTFTGTVTNCSYVDINMAPHAGGTHLATLAAGDQVTIVGETQGWYAVEYNGGIGFISNDYILSAGKNTHLDYNICDDGQTPAQTSTNTIEIENKANEICQGCTTDVQKAKAIYVWIAQNIAYNLNVGNLIDDSKIDQTVAKECTASYTLQHRNSVCLGYAELYYEMCKSVGLKVRVISGNAGQNLPIDGHAWNQVYLPSLGGWVDVDCTWAAAAYRSTSDDGAAEPKSDTAYVLNPNTSVPIYGNCDYFDNPTNFKTHYKQSILDQGFAAYHNNNFNN